MSVSKERKEYLLEKFKYAAKEFGKSGTKSNHKTVPKEQYQKNSNSLLI